MIRIEGRTKILKSLHDGLGHWDKTTTLELISDRIGWPSMRQYVEQYVETCTSCQKMNPLLKYLPSLSYPIRGLFDVFSIDFTGPLPKPFPRGPTYLLICVEQMTSWSIVKATKNATSDSVKEFMTVLIYQYEYPRILVSNNASCFTATGLVDFMKSNGTEWKTVGAYAPMSNGKAEIMVGIIKKAIGILVNGEPAQWSSKYISAVAIYLFLPFFKRKSPHELFYRVRPRFTAQEYDQLPHQDEAMRDVEMMVIHNATAAQVILKKDTKNVHVPPGTKKETLC